MKTENSLIKKKIKEFDKGESARSWIKEKLLKEFDKGESRKS